MRYGDVLSRTSLLPTWSWSMSSRRKRARRLRRRSKRAILSPSCHERRQMEADRGEAQDRCQAVAGHAGRPGLRGYENTVAGADSPSSATDVKSPGERRVAVEVSNAILDRVQVLPRPPSVRSTRNQCCADGGRAPCPGQCPASADGHRRVASQRARGAAGRRHTPRRTSVHSLHVSQPACQMIDARQHPN